MPVAAVRCGGRPTVSAGSAITSRGRMSGCRIARFAGRLASVMMALGSTSAPVPAVVGTAMTGQAPRSRPAASWSGQTKRQSGPPAPATSATALAQSMALPPPSATTPSARAARNAATSASTLPPVGFSCTSVKACASTSGRPAARRACSKIGVAAKPRSVTISGRVMPSSRQRSPSSSTRPAPNRISVGNSQSPRMRLSRLSLSPICSGPSSGDYGAKALTEQTADCSIEQEISTPRMDNLRRESRSWSTPDCAASAATS